MSQKERPSNAKSTRSESALERLRDRESLRTLSLVQRMIAEELNQSGTSRLQKIFDDYKWRNMLDIFDQMLTFAENLRNRKAQEDSAADAAPDDTGDPDDE
jgi:hypothetical protein